MTEQKDTRELAERFPKVPRNAMPTLSWNDINRIQRYGWDEDCYDADFYAKMRVEKNIRRVESVPMLDPAVGKEVVHGAILCPTCGWSRDLNVIVLRKIPVLHRGSDTGIEFKLLKNCSCRLWEMLWDRWSGRRGMVRERYQDVRLFRLKPDSRIMLPLQSQVRLIAHMHEHPEDSYLFCGQTGTGKTTFQTALFSYALREWAQWAFTHGELVEGVWRIETATLMRQHMDWNRGREMLERNDNGSESVRGPALPLVRREDILRAKRSGFRPRLFLDELDKSTLTGPQKTVLFDLIDTIYQCNGQLVVCANSGLVQLGEMLGELMGEATIRRIVSPAESAPGKPTGGCRVRLLQP